MSIVAIDLAARWSAGVQLTEDLRVLDQWSTYHLSEAQFVQAVTAPFRHVPEVEAPYALIVEDLPHQVPYSTLVKTVARVQGRLVESMLRMGRGEWEVIFYPPALWMRSYGDKVWRQGPEVVVEVAKEYGYAPPDLLGEVEDEAAREGRRSKALSRNQAKKSLTDYCAAFLMGRFAVQYYAEHGTYMAPNAQRYRQAPEELVS
jgi:hypothetical protein